MKVGGPLLLVGLVIGLIVSRLPGRHADPGADAVVHPEDRRRRGRDRRRRPVDARPAARLHRGAVPLDPGAGGRRMSPLRPAARAARRRRRRAGFILVLARVAPLFVVAPLFSSRQVPARVRTIVAVALAIGLTPLALHGQHDPQRRARAARARAQGAARRARVRALDRAAVRRASAPPARCSTCSSASPSARSSTRSPATSRPCSTQLYGLVALAVFVAIDGDALGRRGARAHVRPRAADGRAATSRRSARGVDRRRSRRSSPPRWRSPRRCCSRSSSPTSRSAS